MDRTFKQQHNYRALRAAALLNGCLQMIMVFPFIYTDLKKKLPQAQQSDHIFCCSGCDIDVY